MRVNCAGSIGELTTLPGSSQVVVSHGVFVPKLARGVGVGQIGMAERINFMKNELGYDYALCTVEDTNLAQIHILNKFGWKELDFFNSSKTGHRILLFGKHL